MWGETTRDERKTKQGTCEGGKTHTKFEKDTKEWREMKKKDGVNKDREENDTIRNES